LGFLAAGCTGKSEHFLFFFVLGGCPGVCVDSNTEEGDDEGGDVDAAGGNTEDKDDDDDDDDNDDDEDGDAGGDVLFTSRLNR